MTEHKPGTVSKIDAETGEEIPTTPEEQAEAKKAMRDAITGQGGMQLVIAPEALESRTVVE